MQWSILRWLLETSLVLLSLQWGDNAANKVNNSIVSLINKSVYMLGVKLNRAQDNYFLTLCSCLMLLIRHLYDGITQTHLLHLHPFKGHRCNAPMVVMNVLWLQFHQWTRFNECLVGHSNYRRIMFFCICLCIWSSCALPANPLWAGTIAKIPILQCIHLTPDVNCSLPSTNNISQTTWKYDSICLHFWVQSKRKHSNKSDILSHSRSHIYFNQPNSAFKFKCLKPEPIDRKSVV